MKNNNFKESAPVFTKHLIDRRVEINSTVRLSCQVNGLPVPLVLWYKDGQPIDFSGTYTFFFSCYKFVIFKIIKKSTNIFVTLISNILPKNIIIIIYKNYSTKNNILSTQGHPVASCRDTKNKNKYMITPLRFFLCRWYGG